MDMYLINIAMFLGVGFGFFCLGYIFYYLRNGKNEINPIPAKALVTQSTTPTKNIYTSDQHIVSIKCIRCKKVFQVNKKQDKKTHIKCPHCGMKGVI